MPIVQGKRATRARHGRARTHLDVRPVSGQQGRAVLARRSAVREQTVAAAARHWRVELRELQVRVCACVGVDCRVDSFKSLRRRLAVAQGSKLIDFDGNTRLMCTPCAFALLGLPPVAAVNLDRMRVNRTNEASTSTTTTAVPLGVVSLPMAAGSGYGVGRRYCCVCALALASD